MRGGRLQVRLIGPVRVLRDDQPVPLPRSRKVLALLGYLALESEPQSRSRLCDLLWDGPNDPRGELRWCLSKLRALVDDDDRQRVITSGALVTLDLSDAAFDAAELELTRRAEFATLSPEQLAASLAHFRGDLLEGIELDGSPELGAWLAGRRQSYRALRVALARELAARPTADTARAHANIARWLELEPLEPRAHAAWLTLLASTGQTQRAEEHLAHARRAFEHAGLDPAPLRATWTEASKASLGQLADLTQAVSSSQRASASPGASPPAASEPQAPPFERSVAAGAPSFAQPGLDAAPPAPAPQSVRRNLRATVAILPFTEEAGVEAALPPGAADPLGPGLADDIITRLAKLRALFVIARGTSHALAERGVDPREAGRLLRVEYIVSGRVRRRQERVLVHVELAETGDGRIIWTDELGCDGQATFAALDAILDRIVAAIAKEIEAAECQRAVLAPPSSLDAWEAYHRGLWHMYRFKPRDNQQAQHLFRSAIQLDPTFARAHSGLSFTHFQNVFLELSPDRQRQMDLALETAAESLATDERDPSAHWAMGRALWLRGEGPASIAELERSIELSPNYALGHYTLGFVQAQSGDPHAAIRASDTSRALSPFDPLQFGMLGSLALAHLRLGQLDAATHSALAAIARPNAHVHILAIAACILALGGRRDEARALVGRARQHTPGYDLDHFLRAFHFDRDADHLFRQGAKTIGL